MQLKTNLSILLLLSLINLGCTSESISITSTTIPSSDTILIILPQYQFNDDEYMGAKEILENSPLVIASSSRNVVVGLYGLKLFAQKSLNDINPLEYKAIVIIGGVGTNSIENQTMYNIIRKANKNDIIIDAIG